MDRHQSCAFGIKLANSMRWLLTALTTLMLWGCMALGGSQSEPGDGTLYDHRSMSMILSDSNLCSKANANLKSDPQLKDISNFNTTCFEHTILITGQTPSLEMRNHAYAIVADIPGAKRIVNRVTIGQPISTKQALHDSWLSSRIRLNLLADSQIHSTQIKIHTEDGVVYLLGKPPADQAKLAAQIASEIPGSSRVVTLFTPLKVAEHAPKPADH